MRYLHRVPEHAGAQPLAGKSQRSNQQSQATRLGSTLQQTHTSITSASQRATRIENGATELGGGDGGGGGGGDGDGGGGDGGGGGVAVGRARGLKGSTHLHIVFMHHTQSQRIRRALSRHGCKRVTELRDGARRTHRQLLGEQLGGTEAACTTMFRSRTYLRAATRWCLCRSSMMSSSRAFTFEQHVQSEKGQEGTPQLGI